jgi:hypothetical protein
LNIRALGDAINKKDTAALEFLQVITESANDAAEFINGVQKDTGTALKNQFNSTSPFAVNIRLPIEKLKADEKELELQQKTDDSSWNRWYRIDNSDSWYH